jgi:hypothetical protein
LNLPRFDALQFPVPFPARQKFLPKSNQTPAFLAGLIFPIFGFLSSDGQRTEIFLILAFELLSFLAQEVPASREFLSQLFQEGDSGRFRAGTHQSRLQAHRAIGSERHSDYIDWRIGRIEKDWEEELKQPVK